MRKREPIPPLSDLSLKEFLPKGIRGFILNIFRPAIEQLLGIRKMRKSYLDNDLSGLDKQEFSVRLLDLLGVKSIGDRNVLNKLPKNGSCIVVCNHPYGMIEGVVVARLLTSFRCDTKVMANIGLKVFKEIEDYFIFANPLVPKSPLNSDAIKDCFKHLNKGGLLVIFPAGRVSFFQKDKQRISDGEWNRLAVNLSRKTNTPILPVFISGTNSNLFHLLGRIYYRFRLLMLIREMMKLKDKTIKLTAGNLIENKKLSIFNKINQQNDFIRAACYLNDEDYYVPWIETKTDKNLKNIIPKVSAEAIEEELANLSDKQHLLNFKSFSVYYSYRSQTPNCVKEITRLREITFRKLNEGSGEPSDTDRFDDSYMHLFIFDHKEKEIIGAYRIGLTDKLLKKGDLSNLYLSQMFNFSERFINQTKPCLEMGRSFIVEEHQNSFHGLMLLWKGIGAFVSQHPKYRTLYGTVSLSKLYDPRSVALINEVLVEEDNNVTGKKTFSYSLHPEILEFIDSSPLTPEQLSTFIMSIEVDGKDLPVLVKQYQKLGAIFHKIAIDKNFNDTPGLLLSVDLPKSPDKLLKLYLGKEKDKYLSYKSN